MSINVNDVKLYKWYAIEVEHNSVWMSIGSIDYGDVKWPALWVHSAYYSVKFFAAIQSQRSTDYSIIWDNIFTFSFLLDILQDAWSTKRNINIVRKKIKFLCEIYCCETILLGDLQWTIGADDFSK